MSNDTDGCQFWTVQNTLSIVQSKSVFLDHSITEVPAHPKTPGAKPFWFQWEWFMLDETRMMHKSLLSVGTDSDSASAQISPREEIISTLAKYFNLDKNVLGLALSGNHFTTGTTNRVHSYRHSPMLKVLNYSRKNMNILCLHKVYLVLTDKWKLLHMLDFHLLFPQQLLLSSAWCPPLSWPLCVCESPGINEESVIPWILLLNFCG